MPRPKKTSKVTKTKGPMLREGKVVKTPDEEFDDDFLTDDSMLLPNEGESMTPEQDEEEAEEKAQDQELFSGDPALIQAVFDWLDNEIADTDSIEAAVGISKAFECSLENAMIALNVCNKVFTAKKVSFQDIYDSIKEKSS